MDKVATAQTKNGTRSDAGAAQDQFRKAMADRGYAVSEIAVALSRKPAEGLLLRVGILKPGDKTPWLFFARLKNGSTDTDPDTLVIRALRDIEGQVAKALDEETDQPGA